MSIFCIFDIYACYTVRMSTNPEEITFFAQTDARGSQVPFGIKAKDRTRHVYVIGKTGMGKSTLLENMAIQDIKNGNGIAFIDPHGQTAETLLDYIPESRKDDVLYFAPFDTDNPVAFNVMEDVGPDRRHLVVSGLMSVFKKIWVDAWSARMEYILSNTLMALLEYPDATLLGVNRMLSDKDYRKKVVENVKDPSVRSFWVDEFAKYNERYMQEAGDAIKNKIGQFTSNPLIRNIVGQPKSSFDIREMMDQKKIIIMNLSKGLVGESNANLLGSMLTTRIYLAAMSRADMGQEEMRNAANFYFYVDEFQSFANATFANILSEARKYKLNLTIAHQYIEQMEEEVRNAVFGNVGTTIAFRVGPFDAEILETVFTPKFLAPDIVNLGFAQIYLTLMIDGIGSQPFSATTLPPIKPASISAKEMVIERSRVQFSHKRAAVEDAIFAWHGQHDMVKNPASKVESGVPEKKVVYEKKEVSKTGTIVREERTEPPVKRVEYKKESDRRAEVRTTAPVRAKESFEKKEYTKDEQPRSIEKKLKEATVTIPASQSQTSPRVENNEAKNVVSAAPVSSYKKPEAHTQKSGKNLEDLRAVLRTISATENAKAVSKTDSVPETAPVKKESTDTPLSPLRASLAAVINETTKTAHTTATVAATIQPVAVESVAEVQSVEQVIPHAFTPRAVLQQTAPVSDTDPLSPKTLERMMRVTGNDKTPLL